MGAGQFHLHLYQAEHIDSCLWVVCHLSPGKPQRTAVSLHLQAVNLGQGSIDVHYFMITKEIK